jgi:DNA-binding MarR family transcriptional regulator
VTQHSPPIPEVAFRSLLAAYGLINRIMHDHFAQFGISGSQWGVLRALHRAEGEGIPGLRLRDLGERLLVRPPSMTRLVSRMARDGLVTIRPSSHDRRAKEIALTPPGRSLVDRVLKVHPRRIAQLMGAISPDEQRELHRLLDLLNGHLRRTLADDQATHPGALQNGRRRAS